MENNPLLDISRISGKRGSKKSEDRQLMEECRFHIGDVVQHFKRENVNLETAEYFVSVTAPFYLAKLFQPYFSEGAAIVNISSSRDCMSQPQTESYTAAAGSSCRKSYGYCQYGIVPLL